MISLNSISCLLPQTALGCNLSADSYLSSNAPLLPIDHYVSVSSAGISTETGVAATVLTLSLVALAGLVWGIRLRSSASKSETPARPTEPNAPTAPLQIARMYFGVELAAPEVVISGPDDGTLKNAVPTPVEREYTPVLLEEDGRPVREAVPEPSRTGNTVRIVEGEVAAPPGTWSGTGTERIFIRRKTEPLIETVDVVSAAGKRKEFTVAPPQWSLEDQRDYLRWCRGPRSRGLIAPEILESAIGTIDKKTPNRFTESWEALFVVAYLRFSQMGLYPPFDLEREMGLFRQSREHSRWAFESERKDLRALLEVEPSEDNRKVIQYVLQKSSEDEGWVYQPMNRLLHLLCWKRAEAAAGKDPAGALRKRHFDIQGAWRRFSSL